MERYKLIIFIIIILSITLYGRMFKYNIYQKKHIITSNSLRNYKKTAEENKQFISSQSPQLNSKTIFLNKDDMEVKSNISNKIILAKGTFIPVVLEVKITSDSQKNIVAILEENIFHNNQLIVPKGTQIYGDVESIKGDRINIKWDYLNYANKLIKINADSYDTDGGLGVRANVLSHHYIKKSFGVLVSSASGYVRHFIKNNNINTYNTDSLDLGETNFDLNPGTELNIMIEKNVYVK